MSPVKLLATLLLILIADTSSSHGNRHRQTRPRVGPIYPPTNGQPWPMPQYITNLNDEPLLVSPALLNFQVMYNLLSNFAKERHFHGENPI